MLTDEQIFDCLRPLFRSTTALKMAFELSLDEYRAIESAACADRDARIAELERENGQLNATLAEVRKQMESQKDEWLSWDSKRKALEKDAERYRWLRDIAGMGERDSVSVYCGNDFDGSIDAAMKGQQ